MGTVITYHGVKIRVNPRDHYPAHVHVVGNGASARYNIESLEWMESSGFSRSDMRVLEELIKLFLDSIWAEWRRYHEK